jgi:GntR family transcriptional regulator
MLWQLNFKSGLPVYLQLVEQVKAAVASGSLRPDEALPSIRALAEELRVNRNTVAKAYAELESQGVVDTAAGKGCFITDKHSPLKKEVRLKMLAAEIDGAIVQAHHLQIDDAQFIELVRKRLEFFENQNERHERESAAGHVSNRGENVLTKSR